ncbi:1-acyl-sn-glycerol-3-phosphate acyltransferase [Alphaproteobacteria bacterium]|nr:1-acyl-sn-glycerol-3-phosphate acyltransferase [Alphaproteobacteria bacterium]
MFLKSSIFNLVFYISIIFFGIIFIPLLPSKKLTAKGIKLWAQIVIYALKKILIIQIKFENNHVSNSNGAIIAANHKSAFDTIYFLAKFDKVIYIVKEELKYIPIYGWYAIRLGNIFLNRKKRIQSIKRLSIKVDNLIKEGYKVIIFPEGTRSKVNKIGAIKPGIFFIQKNSKKPIYPIYIDSGKTWPKNSFMKHKKNILIKTLSPIEYGLEKSELKLRIKKAFEELDRK